MIVAFWRCGNHSGHSHGKQSSLLSQAYTTAAMHLVTAKYLSLVYVLSGDTGLSLHKHCTTPWGLTRPQAATEELRLSHSECRPVHRKLGSQIAPVFYIHPFLQEAESLSGHELMEE